MHLILSFLKKMYPRFTLITLAFCTAVLLHCHKPDKMGNMSVTCNYTMTSLCIYLVFPCSNRYFEKNAVTL